MTTPAIDLTPPTPAPSDADVTPSDDGPAAPRFTSTPALDVTQDLEGVGSTPPQHPAIAAQAAAKLAEQDTVVRAASTALREFPKTVTEAVAPIQVKLEALEQQRDDLTGEAFAKKKAALQEELHVAVDTVRAAWGGEAEKLLQTMGRDTAARYPVRAERATEVQLRLVQLGQLPLEHAARQVQALVDQALNDEGDQHVRATIQYLLPVVEARFETEQAAFASGTGDAPVAVIRTTVEWARFVLDDTQTYRGRAARALVGALRRQVDLVAETAKEEGRWVGSSAQRVERMLPGGELVSDANTPDLIPVSD